MKGVILAGGKGTRLSPLTDVVSKQLLPVYDKPMIYYPLSVLMLAGIREILIISTPRDLPNFQTLLGDGSRFGIQLSYAEQSKPEGLAQAFIIGKGFIGEDDVCLILGDNIFYGAGLQKLLQESIEILAREKKAVIFSQYVERPERYGVIGFDETDHPLNIIEKPQQPKSNYVVTGLYFYPNSVVEKAKRIVPSKRGELEITDINQQYLEERILKVQKMGRGYVWLDTGTHESLVEATEFVRAVEKRTGLKIGCIEEIAWNQKWIGRDHLKAAIEKGNFNSYQTYLRKLLIEKNVS